MQTPYIPAAGTASQTTVARLHGSPHARELGPIEREGTRWEAALEVRQDGGRWRGRVLFRSMTDGQELRVATADIFLEATEAEVGRRAEGMGQPLMQALLDSAVHSFERKQAVSEDVRQWFRKLLARNASNLVDEAGVDRPELSLARLRNLYDSYRLDQVGHLIALLRPEDFKQCVERLLNGRTIDFNAGDRLQLAMIVVDELERRLPLPPFEVWVEDYLARRPEYQRYAEALHHGAALP